MSAITEKIWQPPLFTLATSLLIWHHGMDEFALLTELPEVPANNLAEPKQDQKEENLRDISS